MSGSRSSSHSYQRNEMGVNGKVSSEYMDDISHGEACIIGSEFHSSFYLIVKGCPVHRLKRFVVFDKWIDIPY
jgi:hypothetical protein